MTEKQKKYLTVGALVIAGLIALYLLLKNNPAAAGSSTTNTLGAPTYGGIGGNAYTLGGVNIPTLPGVNVPSVNLNLPGDGGQSCCSSCGCDSDNGVNGFAASVQQALNGYASAMGNLMNNTITGFSSSIPDFMAQYIATADPQAPGGLNG